MDTRLSKSHVLAGVQDAYWSDEEVEDEECPLCLEELDPSDLGFKPCPCGYQICRFCWHHIKENLNGRCPACRRVYTEEAVEFKAIATEDVRRLNQHKKNKEKERKELEALNRKHLTNVRVVQRNVVYITGVGPRFAREELIPTLRSNVYFGQYGKISKILLVKRNSPSGKGTPVVGLYITYHRREDASRAIAGVDGTASPSGNGEVTRASYGTTKYCIAFLRGVSCSNKGCLDLHEWGDEHDCFTKEDLTTLKHTMKDTELYGRKNFGDSERRSSRRSNWAPNFDVKATNMPSPGRQSTLGLGSSARNRLSKEPTPKRQPKGSRLVSLEASHSVRRERDDKPAGGKETQVGWTMQRATLEEARRPPSPSERLNSARSPTPAADSERGSSIADAEGLLGGLNAPQAVEMTITTSATSKHAPNPIMSSAYQPSSAAQALLDDVRSRRHQMTDSSSGIFPNYRAPFPDFDRTLRNLGLADNRYSDDRGYTFSFNFDPDTTEKDNPPDDDLRFDLAVNQDTHSSSDMNQLTPSMSTTSATSYHGTFDPFGGVGDLQGQPDYSDPFIDSNSQYRGSFDPFADRQTSFSESPVTTVSDSGGPERAMSRFDFARKPQLPSRSGSTHNQILIESLRNSPQLPSPASSFSLVQTGNNDLFAQPPEYPQQSTWPSAVAQQSYTDYSRGPPPGLAQPPPLPKPQGYNIPRIPRESWRTTAEEIPHAPPGLNHPTLIHQEIGFARTPGTFINDASHLRQFADPAIIAASAGYGRPFDTASATNSVYTAQTRSVSPGASNKFSTDDFDVALAQRDGTSVSREFSQPPSDPSSQNNASKPPTPIQSAANESELLRDTQNTKSPGLLPSDFPALPTSSIQSNGNKVQTALPHILQVAPKFSGSKTTKIDPKSEKKDLASKRTAAESLLLKTSSEDNKRNARSTTKPTPNQILPKASILPDPPVEQSATSISTAASKSKANKSVISTDVEQQAPLLSRQAKKEKKKQPKPKASKATRDEESSAASAKVDEHRDCADENNSKFISQVAEVEASRGQEKQSKAPTKPNAMTPIELIVAIDRQMHVYLDDLNFFNTESIIPKSQAPLQYGPLVHALSALSVGGGTFSNSLPSRSIDTAVSSFQTLLETLTQTISDLLRLLPRTTWDDSSSFDGVLRDMLKGDDFFDDPTEEANAKEDEVAALTQALERRARWMEVQLSKLEELHRDINTAAVRAVFALDDRGWDEKGFLPKVGNTLNRFEDLVRKSGKTSDKYLPSSELEKRLSKCLEAEKNAENALRRSMDSMIKLRSAAID